MDRRAWIEQLRTWGAPRFRVVEVSTLFPGHRNVVLATWASRAGAIAYIRRNGLHLEDGPCPLPEVPKAKRLAYRNHQRKDSAA